MTRQVFDAGSSTARIAAYMLPPALFLSTYLAFNALVALFGFHVGYFLGFLFKWTFWCLVVPLWLLGPEGVRGMFRPPTRPVSSLNWLLLALPLVIAYGYAFPRALPHATLGIVVLSAIIAFVNGTLEEVLWRGTFTQLFPREKIWAWLYPSLGFALWHIAPQSVTGGASTPGGTAAFVVAAALFGLCWGWVAYRTGSIRGPIVSHVLLDFAGFGALIYIR